MHNTFTSVHLCALLRSFLQTLHLFTLFTIFTLFNKHLLLHHYVLTFGKNESVRHFVQIIFFDDFVFITVNEIFNVVVALTILPRLIKIRA